MRKSLMYVTVPVCLSIIAAGAWFVRAGSLTPPPGPVAGTMVTLDDLMVAVTAIGGGGGGGDTRTPITALPFTILAPGSYVVTMDLVSVGTPGITIVASDVTIDLNGFEMTGLPAGPGEDAIVLFPGFDNVTVFNGSIHDWGGDGLDLAGGMGHRVYDVTVESCGENGVLLGSNSRLSDCIIRLNAGDGIAAVDNNRIVNTVATLNGVPGGPGLGLGDGIFLGGINNTLEGCVLASNFDDGVGSAFATNTAHDCTAETNGGSGFFGVARLTDCLANVNGSDGVFLTNGVAINCVANGNGLNGFDVAFSHLSD
ncbi:MAG: right-handed parallel beta-helix repeat-containing protein [Phycisphaerae bacterium]